MDNTTDVVRAKPMKPLLDAIAKATKYKTEITTNRVALQYGATTASQLLRHNHCEYKT